MEVSRTEQKSLSMGISWCVPVQTPSLLDGAEAIRDTVSYFNTIPGCGSGMVFDRNTASLRVQTNETLLVMFFEHFFLRY